MESTKTVKEKEKKEPMTPKQKTFFILKIIGNVIFYTIIIALFLFSIMNINSGGKGGIPNLFGKGYLSVQSTSMSIEQDVYNQNNKLPKQYDSYPIKSFNKGDLIHVEMLNESSIQNLQVGDVITFWSNKLNAYNTHRIVYMAKDADGKITSISTQGDNSVLNKGIVFNPQDTENSQAMMLLDQSGDIDTFGAETFYQIKAKTTGVSAGTGAFIDNVQKYWLFIFVIPICVILIIEVILVIKNIMDLRREKNKAVDLADHEAQMAELQNEKERMRQELLAELRAQGAIQDEPKPTEEPKVEETPVVAEEAKAEAKEETTTEEVKEDVVESEEKAEEPAEEPVEEKTEETEVETPTEDKNEEVVEETTTEEVNETPASEPEEEVKEEKEEPVVNKEEVEEPNLDIEENEEVEEKPAKKATTKKSTGTKKSSTTKK